jgi:hypothetical protein
MDKHSNLFAWRISLYIIQRQDQKHKYSVDNMKVISNHKGIATFTNNRLQ